MSRVRFLYLMTEGLDETVIDSQVVDSLVAVAGEGVHFDLMALMPPRAYLARRPYYQQRSSEVAGRIGGRVRVIPHPRKFDRSGALLAAGRLLLETRRPTVDRLVVHARTDWAAYFAACAARRSRRVRYLFDARGDGEAELRLEGRQRGLGQAAVEASVRRYRQIRLRASAGAEHVLCVSSVLRDRLVAAADLDPARTSVVPCVADAGKFHLAEEERTQARHELGVDDRFVVVYAGRLGRWHYGRETFEVVRGLLEAFPDAFFLVLTPDLGPARELAEGRLPEGRYAIRTAAHAEVPRLLRAADLGMLLRAPDPLNEVACPTKFAEYVMSGLPLLISPGIGDCSGFVAEHCAGAVLGTPDPAAAVEAVRRLRQERSPDLRRRIAAAGSVLSRQRYAAALAGLYRRIAEAP